jgi:hypothetical protein
LERVYPEHEQVWAQHKSKHKVTGYWKDVKNQRSFFDQLAIKLNVKQPEDWLNVTSEVLKESKGFVNTYYNGSVVQGK